MIVFKICREKYAHSLTASGMANRWNKADEFVIYTASSISLATLEMVAHRSGIIPQQPYKLLKIFISDSIAVQEIKIKQLPSNWRSIQAYSSLQGTGSKWYHKRESLLLKIPSAIIPEEYNYAINTIHPDFKKKIKIVETTDFIWDERIL